MKASSLSHIVHHLARATALCALFVACSADRKPGELFGPSEEGVLVIDAILVVDQKLPDLFLKQTIAPGALQTADALIVEDAQLVLRVEDSSYIYPRPRLAGTLSPPSRCSKRFARARLHH